METREKEKKKEDVEFYCDSSRCWKCSGNVCEERYEDLVFAAGP